MDSYKQAGQTLPFLLVTQIKLSPGYPEFPSFPRTTFVMSEKATPQMSPYWFGSYKLSEGKIIQLGVINGLIESFFFSFLQIVSFLAETDAQPSNQGPLTLLWPWQV